MMKPRRVELMVDDVAGIALWDRGEITARLEDELPLRWPAVAHQGVS
jgi:hypothetical protein